MNLTKNQKYSTTNSFKLTFCRYSSLVKKTKTIKVRSVIVSILAASLMYNAPRFFEYDPTYTVTYICPSKNLSSFLAQESTSKVLIGGAFTFVLYC